MKGKKRLLVLTSTFPRWENDDDPPFVFELCKRLKANYSIYVLAPHFPGSQTESNFDKIHVKRFRYFFKPLEKLAYQGGILARLKKYPLLYGLLPFFLAGELLAVINMLRRYQFHLIHAHWLIPQGMVAVLARQLTNSTVPLLCTSHGGDLFGLQGVFLNWIKKQVGLKSDALTLVSNTMIKEIEKFGVNQQKVHVIPMGVDLKKRFVPVESKKNNPSLLFVGRLVEKKGLYYLIHALPEIFKRHPMVHLQIVGDGPEKNRIKKVCDRLGVSDRVHFFGAVKNELLPAFYQVADVVIFPSVIAEDGDREGFGLVLVEALGCECAVVVTDLPAMRDIIIDGKTGFVVPQKDVQTLAEKIISLVDDPETGRSVGKEGRRFVVERYDWDRIAKKYAALIESIPR